MDTRRWVSKKKTLKQLFDKVTKHDLKISRGKVPAGVLLGAFQGGVLHDALPLQDDADKILAAMQKLDQTRKVRARARARRRVRVRVRVRERVRVRVCVRMLAGALRNAHTLPVVRRLIHPHACTLMHAPSCIFMHPPSCLHPRAHHGRRRS